MDALVCSEAKGNRSTCKTLIRAYLATVVVCEHAHTKTWPLSEIKTHVFKSLTLMGSRDTLQYMRVVLSTPQGDDQVKGPSLQDVLPFYR